MTAVLESESYSQLKFLRNAVGGQYLSESSVFENSIESREIRVAEDVEALHPEFQLWVQGNAIVVQ